MSVTSQAEKRELSSDALRGVSASAGTPSFCNRVSTEYRADRTRSQILSNPRRTSFQDDQRRGAHDGRNVHTPDGELATSEWVVARLEEAGAALLSLPYTGYSTRLRVGTLHPVPSAEDMLHALPNRPRAPVPSAACVDRMDQALTWVSLIPESQLVLRRIVHARALVNPLTGKHLFAWRRLASEVNTDHKAIQRWHAQGIGIIVAALNGHGR